MRHFLFEFITGGGMVGQPLPDTLAAEGELMIRAVIDDLLQAGQDNIVLCRDYRLPLLDASVRHLVIDSTLVNDIPLLTEPDDVVWLIAPETNACLESWVRRFQERPVRLFAADIPSVQICSSKFATFKALQEHGISVVNTVRDSAPLPDSQHGWIVKPDDGAGAEAIRYFKDKDLLQTFLNEAAGLNTVVQPYVDGMAMSLSMLCLQGDVRLVGCNRQYVDIVDDCLTLTAVGVNECLQYQPALLVLAKEIAAAMPGLSGYIGVDLICEQNEFRVVEINPRLTTAYVGLSSSTSINMAEVILKLFLDQQLADIDISRARPIRIPL